MSIDDLTTLAKNSLLLSLDRIVGPRLIKVVYLLGLAGAVLLSIRHFFATFSQGFSEGIWGLIEIAVFGLLGIIALRVVCEGFIVFFKSHGHEAEPVRPTQASANLIDEVRDAIEDLATETTQPAVTKSTPAKAATKPAPARSIAKTRAAKTSSVRKPTARAAKKTD